jgi:hypothetical protein
MAVSAAEMQQVQAALQAVMDRLNNVEHQLGAASRVNNQLTNQVNDLSAKLAAAEQRAGLGGGDDKRGGLFDKKLYEPQPLEDQREFKEWAEDLQDWVQMCDKDIPILMSAAAREKNVITTLGGTPALEEKAKPLFRMLKRFIKLKSARQVVSLTPGKNPYEAWRLLFAKFAPRNDATAGAIVLKICDWKAWKCKVLGDVPVTIAAWEKMQDEYTQEFGDKPINEITRREMLRNMLPDEIRSYLETQTMLRDDLTFDQIKKCCNDLAQRVAKVPIPMEIGAFGAATPGAPPGGAAPAEPPVPHPHWSGEPPARAGAPGS